MKGVGLGVGGTVEARLENVSKASVVDVAIRVHCFVE